MFEMFEFNKKETVIGNLSLMNEYDLSLKRLASFALVTTSQEISNNRDNIMVGDLSDYVNFDLASQYVKVVSTELGAHQLVTRAIIDRDSNEFEALNGVLNLWIKCFYLTNPFSANYYKVSFVIFYSFLHRF